MEKNKIKIKYPRLIDLTGQRFGKLTPIKPVGKNNQGKVLWLCNCDCGEKTVVAGYRLRRGDTKSCGCLKIKMASIVGKNNIKHGYSRTKIYTTWHDMIQRCTNPKNKAYQDYGGRGITVCKRWLSENNGFINFFKDMGECPKGKSLDRINNNKLINGYSPRNCCWSTPKEQNRNMRNNVIIPFDSKDCLLIDLLEKYNIDRSTLKHRLNKQQMSIKEALMKPIRKHKKYKRRN